MDNEIKRKFIERQIRHLRFVHNSMILLELNKDKLPFEIDDWKILRRAMLHDLDKFSDELVNGYYNLKKYHLKNAIKKVDRNDILNNNDIYTCCNIHYMNNRHHIEYHEKNNEEFSNLDICELCCDMHAKSKDHGADSIEYFNKYILPNSRLIQKHKDNIIHIFELLDELDR